MDFARKQLEKYGWTDGKGLGKHENGISQALKPKLKRSVTGIGYDAAADFTEHWWSALYDKAASNVEVEEKNGKTKKMKRKDNKDFEITNSTWKLKRNTTNDNTEEYSEFFVKTAVLDGDSSKVTKVKVSDSESDREDGKDVTKMTDEELFAACQGRTAHKGARHGLRALGKLARIEQQEQLLLRQAKYNSFKNKNNADSQVVEDSSLNDEFFEKKMKRKKKKRCNSNDNEFIDVNNTNIELCEDLNGIETSENIKNKTKKSKNKEIISEEVSVADNDDNSKQENKIKKKKRKHTEECIISDETLKELEIQEFNLVKKKKKKKNKNS